MANLSLILLSGGLDSSLSLLIARQESQLQCAITINYGQKSFIQEMNAAAKICGHYHIQHQTIQIPFLADQKNHPFFNNDLKCPQPELNELDNLSTTQNTAKAVWVPNRNGVFINIAAAIAEQQNINSIYVGFNAEEATTFPDNSQDFITAINNSLSYSTLNQVKVKCPTIEMHKTEILNNLITQDFPLPYLWSCYNNQDNMCGLCESCKRLKRALINNQQQPLTQSLFNN
ncbi:7-cyano-7-deazaguanine synthase QueC [bacterium K02(2017)]|nr:7-cyano-7-deazaguanine synthase QueC [bacterium K02(2017)]